MKCPRDKTELTIKSKEGVVGFCCGECSGIFLKDSGMKAFKINFQTEVLEYRFKKLTHIGSSLSCSNCLNQMHTTFIDEVEIDICLHCQGVWFDKSEVKTIISNYGSRIPRTEGTGYGVKEEVGFTALFWFLGLFGGGGGSC